MKINVGHSPDADDAFMFYALNFGKIDTGGYSFEHTLRDIETLNRWALESKLEVTALSVHAFAHVADQYALMPHGASIGDNYGPIVVALKEMQVEELSRKRIAIPGELTTAFLALRLCLPSFIFEVVPFDQIFQAVRSGRVDAGLIIHEGQLTYMREGFKKVLDLGEWWHTKTSLPLPLGVNGIRKDLGKDAIHDVNRLLRESIDYALAHREEAMQYAMKYARNTDPELADRFVAMYVNHFTREFGERGMTAVRRLLDEASAAGFIPKIKLELSS